MTAQTYPNIYAAWLELIGTPQRAATLLHQLWKLDGITHRGNCRGLVNKRRCSNCNSVLRSKDLWHAKPPIGPAAVIYGIEAAQRIYAIPRYTDALDAWDMQLLTKQDIRNLCNWILDNYYDGRTYGRS